MELFGRGFYLYDGQIVIRIGSDEPSGPLGPVGQGYLNTLGVFDDMVIGKDIAAFIYDGA